MVSLNSKQMICNYDSKYYEQITQLDYTAILVVLHPYKRESYSSAQGVILLLFYDRCWSNSIFLYCTACIRSKECVGIPRFPSISNEIKPSDRISHCYFKLYTARQTGIVHILCSYKRNNNTD